MAVGNTNNVETLRQRSIHSSVTQRQSFAHHILLGETVLRNKIQPKNAVGGTINVYRDRLKGLYVVARSLFLLLLSCSAWPCLGPA